MTRESLDRKIKSSFHTNNNLMSTRGFDANVANVPTIQGKSEVNQDQSDRKSLKLDLSKISVLAPSTSPPPPIQAKGINADQPLSQSQVSQQNQVPSIQAFYADRPPIPWHTATDVSISGKGVKGVLFVKDITNQPVVVKATTDDIGETNLASTLHKQAGTTVPVTRPAESAEKPGLIKLLNSNIVDWDQVAAKRGSNKPGDGDFLKNTIIQNFQTQPIVVMGIAEGKDFTDIIKKDPNKAYSLFSDPAYLQKLGKIHAVDLFLGNSDRIGFDSASNLGNWMTNGQNQITAIDNVSDSQDTLLMTNSGAVTESLKKLAPSKLQETATESVNFLIKAAKYEGMPETWFTEERKQVMINNIMIGLATGRKMLIDKLTAKFMKKRSREVKAQVLKGGGEEQWNKLKARAAALKSLG